MSIDIILPKLGFTMDEGSVSGSLAANGGAAAEGQPRYTIESDKSIQEIQAPARGTLKTLEPVGGVCPVGTVLGTIE